MSELFVVVDVVFLVIMEVVVVVIVVVVVCSCSSGCSNGSCSGCMRESRADGDGAAAPWVPAQSGFLNALFTFTSAPLSS